MEQSITGGIMHYKNQCLLQGPFSVHFFQLTVWVSLSISLNPPNTFLVICLIAKPIPEPIQFDLEDGWSGPPKCWYPPAELHGVTTQKTTICTFTLLTSTLLNKVTFYFLEQGPIFGCFICGLLLLAKTSLFLLLLSKESPSSQLFAFKSE